jgi:hypothetical protein
MLEIIHPVTGDKLQVADQDFSDDMDWNQAVRACNELGSGWRLPSKEELMAMYNQLYEKGIGNFKDDTYWSSSEYTDYIAWFIFFSNGSKYDVWFKNYTFSVRAVRSF